MRGFIERLRDAVDGVASIAVSRAGLGVFLMAVCWSAGFALRGTGVASDGWVVGVGDTPLEVLGDSVRSSVIGRENSDTLGLAPSQRKKRGIYAGRGILTSGTIA